MAELSDKFNPELCEKLTGYTFRDVIAMYEDMKTVLVLSEELGIEFKEG